MSKYINISGDSIQFDDSIYINQPPEIIEYIKELQNRITELEQINEEHQKINGKLMEENNRLKESMNCKECCFIKDNVNYMQRIDKAIKYMDRCDLEWGSPEHEEMMQILKGEK